MLVHAVLGGKGLLMWIQVVKKCTLETRVLWKQFLWGSCFVYIHIIHIYILFTFSMFLLQAEFPAGDPVLSWGLRTHHARFIGPSYPGSE